VDRTAVGFIGSAAFAGAQQQIVRHVPGLTVGGCWCGPAPPPGDLPAGLLLYPSPADLLASNCLQAVAVGAPLVERAYWCEQVAGAGKVPVCLAPPGHQRAEIGAALARCSAAGHPLRLVDRSDAGTIAVNMDSILPQCGRVVFFTLDVKLDRDELAADQQGVLLQAAVGYLGRLASLHGPLESVWGEARSLLWGRLAEDVAVAYLRAVDGCEGVVTVSGLGPGTQATLRAYGRRASVEYTDGQDAGLAAAWRCAYADLSGRSDQPSPPPLTIAQLEAGATLAQWIARAARAHHPLHHREANA
jgi:hypothetical protein